MQGPRTFSRPKPMPSHGNLVAVVVGDDHLDAEGGAALFRLKIIEGVAGEIGGA